MRNFIFTLAAGLHIAIIFFTTAAAGSGKVGLAWSLGLNDPAIKNFVTPKVSAIYTWGPQKPAGADPLHLQFDPMLYDQSQINDFVRIVKPGYAKWAMGFNEPDTNSQSSLSPTQAATLWKTFLQPLKSHGYKLVSPAVSSNPAGKVWLKAFMGACTGCSFDVVALHWYGTNPQEFINYVTDFRATFGKNIWVTEFACQNFAGGPQANAAQVKKFMDTVTAWMDQTSYVKQYFAFGLTHNMQGINPLDQLVANNGKPTALGQDYIT